MDGKEKVIKGLEICSTGHCEISCPYHNTPQCTWTILSDALALLKEQDTVEHALDVLRNAGWTETQDVPFPAELLKEQEAKWLEVDDKHDAFDCSNCGAMAGRKCLYCPGCGAKMKNGTRAMEGR